MENTLERAAIMSEEGRVDRGAISMAGLEDKLDVTPAPQTQNSVDFDDPDLDEREKVIAALEQSGWVQAKAARLLNMTPRQIAYRIQTLKIKMRRI
jgi:Nif-specific regulatory protein